MTEVLKDMPLTLKKVRDEVSRVVISKEREKEILMVAILCGGHILIEGPVGTAKTSLARTFAQVIGGEFKRVQFTPDMLPADVTGFYLYTLEGESRFVPGPVFANILLADELNRATPRTQAALLEAMQEGQVTIEGKTHLLPRPFMVIASQLPYGGEGTYPLTDAQVDRFMFRALSTYPSEEEEREVIGRIDYLERPDVKAVIAPDELLRLQGEVRSIHVSEKVRDYIVSLARALRYHRDVLLGPSPRASIALYKGSRALAYLEGRDFVLPDDVKRLLQPALMHRIRLRPEAEMEDITPEMVIDRVAEEVAVPKVN